MKQWIENLKSIMREKGETQESFAEKLGLTQGAIGHKLRGKRDISVDEIIEYARILNVSVSQVLDESEIYCSREKKMPLISLDVIQGRIDSGENLFSAGDNIDVPDGTPGGFCLNMPGCDCLSIASFGILLELRNIPRVGDTVLCKINNKYGTSLVVAKYSESLKAPTLTNVKDSRGDVPDINLDEVDYEVVAVKVGIIGLQG